MTETEEAAAPEDIPAQAAAALPPPRRGSRDGPTTSTAAPAGGPRSGSVRPASSIHPRAVLAPHAVVHQASPSEAAATAALTGGAALALAPRVYCRPLDENMSAEECRRLTEPDPGLRKAAGAFSAPHSMYRGERRQVLFAVAAGADPARPRSSVTIAGNQTVLIAPAAFRRFASARLTGEGFEISPTDEVRKDAGTGDELRWEWNVTALRGPRHTLTLEAKNWRLGPGGQLIPAEPVFSPPLTIEVPIRFYPDRLDDFYTDSMAWFKKGEAWLMALKALLIALLAVGSVLGIRRLTKKAPA